MDWRVKAALQGVLARAPLGMRLNDALQTLGGGRRNLGEHIDTKVRADWLVHARHLTQLGLDIQGKTMLEIGTGWLPVMPLCFAVAGLQQCITVDLNRHLQLALVPTALKRLEQHLDAMADACGQSTAQLQQRWRHLMEAPDAAAMLERAGIRYQAPGDATQTGLPDRSVDLVFSNSVLEHVPASVLPAMMQEAVRILRPGGLALHNVNCGDHYAYFDRAITPIHYLRFTEAQWRWWNNDILYQNRLRAIDFIQASEQAGLRVVLDTHHGRTDLLQRLPQLPIAAQFQHYAADELCCTSLDFAATPAGVNP